MLMMCSTPTGTARPTTTRRSTASKRRSGFGRLPLLKHPFAEGSRPSAASPAPMRGYELSDLLLDPSCCPPMARGGLAPATMAGHRRELRRLADLPLDLLPAPADRALIEFLARQRRARGWKWSTTTTKFAQLQGALALLPLYAKVAEPVLLRLSPAWRMAMKACQRRANEERGHQAKAATSTAIKTVLETDSIPWRRRAAILLAWLCAARCGDTLKLRRSDVTLLGQKLSVTWARGKTVARRGPYTVHTSVPATFLPLLQQALNEPMNEMTMLFPDVTGPQLKVALRTVDPLLEQRSIRRGSLQTLASLGMPLSTLLLFSGHTSERMLLRYLGHGKLARCQQDSMLAVAGMAFGAQ